MRVLVNWYYNQIMMVRWGDATSAPFQVMVLDRGTGCMSDSIHVNHLMYADNLVVCYGNMVVVIW